MPSYSIHYDGDDRNLLDLYIEEAVKQIDKPVAEISRWVEADTGLDYEVTTNFYLLAAKDGVLDVAEQDDEDTVIPTEPTGTVNTSRITEIRFH